MREQPHRRTASFEKFSRALVRVALLSAVAVSVPLAFPADAHAEPNAADKETARRLMAEARDKRTANDLKGALSAFQAADAIMKVPTTGMEVARTQVALSLLVEARDTALRVARSQPEQEDPPPFTRAREEARQLSEDLVKKIPTVTLVVSGAEPGAIPNVTVDGAGIPAASLGMPRTLNPGHHTITGSAGGKQAKAEVDLAEAQHLDVKLELVASTGPIVAPPPPPPPPPPVESSGGIGKPLFIGGAVVAGAGLVLGSITGVMSLSKTSSIKSNCKGNTCPASQQSDIDSANSLATVSTIGFIVGGAGAAVGVIGLILWSGEGKKEGHAASVTPWVGLGSAGVRGSF